MIKDQSRRDLFYSDYHVSDKCICKSVHKTQFKCRICLQRQSGVFPFRDFNRYMVPELQYMDWKEMLVS